MDYMPGQFSGTFHQKPGNRIYLVHSDFEFDFEYLSIEARSNVSFCQATLQISP